MSDEKEVNAGSDFKALGDEVSSLVHNSAEGAINAPTINERGFLTPDNIIVADVDNNYQMKRWAFNPATDVIEDGVCKCRKCGATILEYNPLYKNFKFVPCKCRMPEIKREWRARKFVELKQLSDIPEKYWGADLSKCEGVGQEYIMALGRIRKYVANCSEILENGAGIYFYGGVGTGKTYLACAILNAMGQRGYTFKFTSVSDIVDRMLNKRDGSDEDYNSPIANMAKYDFVVIDDIGTEKILSGGDSNWLQDKVFEIINARYLSQKPTIFTSNYSLPDMIKKGYSSKTIDRINEMSYAKIRIDGISMRSSNRKKNLF